MNDTIPCQRSAAVGVVVGTGCPDPGTTPRV